MGVRIMYYSSIILIMFFINSLVGMSVKRSTDKEDLVPKNSNTHNRLNNISEIFLSEETATQLKDQELDEFASIERFDQPKASWFTETYLTYQNPRSKIEINKNQNKTTLEENLKFGAKVDFIEETSDPIDQGKRLYLDIALREEEIFGTGNVVHVVVPENIATAQLDLLECLQLQLILFGKLQDRLIDLSARLPKKCKKVMDNIFIEIMLDYESDYQRKCKYIELALLKKENFGKSSRDSSDDTVYIHPFLHDRPKKNARSIKDTKLNEENLHNILVTENENVDGKILLHDSESINTDTGIKGTTENYLMEETTITLQESQMEVVQEPKTLKNIFEKPLQEQHDGFELINGDDYLDDPKANEIFDIITENMTEPNTGHDLSSEEELYDDEETPEYIGNCNPESTSDETITDCGNPDDYDYSNPVYDEVDDEEEI